MEGPTLLVAFNYSDFLVSTVLNPGKRATSLIVQRWMKSAEDVSAILDAHLGLAYKLKKDSMLIDKTVNIWISLRNRQLM
jgi:hypothetical protein